MNITQLEDFSNTKPEVRYLTEEIIKYLNANQGGGGGLIPESYQNSAMSTPVYAYVYRDSNDNIVRVYEPLRNNDVRFKTYTDKFPFDNTNCYNNSVNDVDFQNISSDVVLHGNILETMVINGGGNSALSLIQIQFKGNYGLNCPNDAEIYITGDTVLISNSRFFCGQGAGLTVSYLDSIGSNSTLQDNDMYGGKIVGNGHTVSLIESFLNNSRITFEDDNGQVDSAVMFWAGLTITNSYVGDNNFFNCDGAGIIIYNCPNCQYNNFYSTHGINSVFNDISGSFEYNIIMSRADVIITACTNFKNNIIESNAIVTNNNFSIINTKVGINSTWTPIADTDGMVIQKISGTNYRLGVSGGNVTATAI